MDLLIKRNYYGPDFTHSQLYTNGNYFCEVLERYDANLTEDNTKEEVQEAKKKYNCCIPTGTYKIILTYSNTFKKTLPLLLNVIGFSGIRIHEGNTSQSSKGCLLVGTKTNTPSFIANSKKTLASLMDMLKNEKEITITIIRE